MKIQVKKESERAYVEVLETIKHMDSDLVKKIPQKLIQFFEEHKDKNYQFKFDENIDIDNQKISIEAGSILAMLMLNYIANEQEKNEINNILAENEKKYEEELREKYNPDNLFKKKVIYI